MNKYILIILLFFYNISYSQNNEGEIEDAQILIEKNSSIVLPKVDKIINKINNDVYTLDREDIQFSYLNYLIINDNKKIDKFIRLESENNNISKNNIRLQVGNYKSFLIHGKSKIYEYNNWSSYFNLYHKSNYKGIYHENNSRFNESDFDLYLKHSKRNNTFDALLNFKKIITGYYGYLENFNKVDFNDIKINTSKYSIDYGYSYSNKKILGRIENKNSFYKDLLYDEYNNIINLKINYLLSKKLNFLIAFNNDYYHLNSFDKLIINTYNLSGLVKYNVENFYLLIGGKLNRSSKSYKGKSKNFGGIYPIVNLKYKLNNLSFNVNYGGGLFANKYSEKIYSNPFIYDPFIFGKLNNTNEKFNIKTSVEYQLNNNGNIKLSYSKKALSGFTNYIYNNKGNYPVTTPIYLYTLIRYDEDTYISQINFSFKFPINSYINPSFDFVFREFDNEEYKYDLDADVLYKPKYNLNIKNEILYNRLKSNIGVHLLLDSYAMDFNSNIININDYINLYLYSNYQLNDKISFELDINNILNKRNEFYFMYPELGFNAMAGILLKF
ncbi:MAG TPA: hypothetical protein EYQ68_06580 [Cytophagales bacterium]|nr:hypothetical protein [Cytophagales bacterium]